MQLLSILGIAETVPVLRFIKILKPIRSGPGSSGTYLFHLNVLSDQLSDSDKNSGTPVVTLRYIIITYCAAIASNVPGHGAITNHSHFALSSICSGAHES